MLSRNQLRPRALRAKSWKEVNMTKVLSVLLLMVLTVGVLGVAQTAVTPRTAEGALLFDNETGADAIRIGILFDSPVTISKGNIVAFGGGAVTRVDAGVRTVWIDVVIVPGGTLLINLAGDAQVSSAYWVSSPEEKNTAVFLGSPWGVPIFHRPRPW